MKLRVIPLIVALVLVLVAISRAEVRPEFTRFSKGQVGYDLNGLTFAVDARLELLTVLQSLCGHWVINRDSSEYLDGINSYFDKYRDHKLVRLLRSFYKNGIWEQVPYETMLSLNSDFKPDTAIRNPDPLNVHTNRDTATLFLDLIAQFTVETKFYRFFEEQMPFYKRLLSWQVERLGSFDEMRAIEAFYGSKQDGYSLFLLPLDFSSKGINVLRDNNKTYAYFLCGCPELSAKGVRSKLDFTCLCWHEFGHTFVNPLTWKYRELVAKYSTFYGPIQYVRDDGYPNWGVAINEQIVRASSVFIASKEFGPEGEAKAMSAEVAAYFLYTPSIFQALKRYDHDRARYPTFESYLPELMKSFDSTTIPETRSSFILGPRYFMEDSCIVIYPTNEESSAQKQVGDYITAYYDKELKRRNCTLMADTIALMSNLSKKSLLIVGTYFGNRFLASQIDKLPFHFSREEIVGLDTCRGRNLTLVSSWANPTNPSMAELICTSNHSLNIVGILDQFPSWQIDFLLFDGKRIASEGYFRKQGDRWEIQAP